MKGAPPGCVVAASEEARDMATDANAATVEQLRAIFESGTLDEASRLQHELAADDFVQEWPQSGERIRGRDNAKAINDNYPEMTGSTPRLSLGRVSGEGAHWVVEGTIDYGDGTPVNYVGITELRDGKIARVTEYFANPFEAPAWRSRWVEPIS
jgi:ketosteroid isomerase-like protein